MADIERSPSLSLWDWVPKIYICSTDNPNRPNQLNDLHDRLKKLGMNPDNTQQVYINRPPRRHYMNDPSLSCTQNHLECYRKFLNDTTPDVGFAFFLEDDVFIRPGMEEDQLFEQGITVLKEFLTSQSPNAWSVLYPGHVALQSGSDIIKRDKFSIRDSVSWCTHALFLSRPCIEKMVSLTPETLGYANQSYQPLAISHRMTGNLLRGSLLFNVGIDSYYANAMLAGDLKTLALYPQIIYQDSQGIQWMKTAERAEWWCQYVGSWILAIMGIIIIGLIGLCVLFYYLYRRATTKANQGIST